jgi:hypothetical protein
MAVRLGPALREEHRLREVEDRVLRRILGPRRAEVTGGLWGSAQYVLFAKYN